MHPLSETTLNCTFTRGPWTATLALIKVDESTKLKRIFLHAKNSQNWCNFLGIGTVSVHMSKWLQKWTFSLATPQLDEVMDQSETPL